MGPQDLYSTTSGGLPQMAPLRLGIYPNFHALPIFHLCQISSDLYKTLNFSSWGPHSSSQDLYSSWAIPNGYFKTRGIPKFSFSPFILAKSMLIFIKL